MAVFQNTASEVGDIIQIVADVPIIGLIALSSFVDETEDETGDKYFTKQFRYSIDGVNYSAWQTLSNANLLLISVQSNDTFYAQYNYQRAGSDASGTIAFDSVTLSGEFLDVVDGPVYTDSNFAKYFVLNNLCSIAWSVNVLEKLYKEGLLPKFITRNFNSTNADDRDFLDFWRSITHYFALFVCLARQFQTFYTNPKLLLEYLVQRGMFICTDTEYVDLLYLMENYYDEIRQRGTRKVFLPKGHISSIGTKAVDGEYLRLICFDDLDEFLYNLNNNKHIGWNLNNSSPLYKGLVDRLNVNKYYTDFIDDIRSVTELSIADSSLPYVSIVRDGSLDPNPDESDSLSDSFSSSTSESDTDHYDRVIKILPGDSVGLGKGVDKRIIVNPKLDYEISFFIKNGGVANSGLGSELVFNGEFTGSSNGWTIGGLYTYPPDGFYYNSNKVSFNASIGVIINSWIEQDLTSELSSTMKDYTLTFVISNMTGTEYGLNPNIALLIFVYDGVEDQIGLYGNGIHTVNVSLDNSINFKIRFGTDNFIPINVVVGSYDIDDVSLKEVLVNITPTFTFGVDCWDKNDNIIQPLHIQTLVVKNDFLNTVSLNQGDRYYFVRGIIYNKYNYKDFVATTEYPVDNIMIYGGSYYKCKIATDAGETPVSDPEKWEVMTADEVAFNLKTNIGQGNNLVFVDDIVKIDPYILYNNTNGSTDNLYVYNIRVHPLSTPYSKDFIGMSNFLELWSTNNNQMLSEGSVNDILKKYLMPMNVLSENIFTESELN